MNGYLLDENLPHYWPVASNLPVFHARMLGEGATDSELRTIAQRERWGIVSKDGDFAERIVAIAPPPWVIHLCIGNLRSAEFRAFIAHIWPQVEALLPAHKLVSVYADRIEAITSEVSPLTD